MESNVAGGKYWRLGMLLGVAFAVLVGCTSGDGSSKTGGDSDTQVTVDDSETLGTIEESTPGSLAAVLYAPMLLRIGTRVGEVDERTDPKGYQLISFQAVVEELVSMTPRAEEMAREVGALPVAGKPVLLAIPYPPSMVDQVKRMAAGLADHSDTYCLVAPNDPEGGSGMGKLPALRMYGCFVRTDPKVEFLFPPMASTDQSSLAFLADSLKMSEFEVFRYGIEGAGRDDLFQRLSNAGEPKLPTWDELPAAARTFDDPQFRPPPELAAKLVSGVVSVSVAPGFASPEADAFLVIASPTARIHTASLTGGSHTSAVRMLPDEPVSVYVLARPEADLGTPLQTLPKGLAGAQGLEIFVEGRDASGSWQVRMDGCILVVEGASNECRAPKG